MLACEGLDKMSNRAGLLTGVTDFLAKKFRLLVADVFGESIMRNFGAPFSFEAPAFLFDPDRGGCRDMM